MKALLVLFIIFSCLSCSNDATHKNIETNITLNCDSALADQRLIVLARYNSTFFDDKYTGLVESHFENNPKQLEWVIHYQDGKIVKHEGYYANGNKQFVKSIMCNSIHGLNLIFNPNGTIAEESLYILGKREGLAKGYYPNGKLQRTVNFKNNLKHGEQYEFNQNGDSTEMGVFIKGEMVEKRTITHR